MLAAQTNEIVELTVGGAFVGIAFGGVANGFVRFAAANDNGNVLEVLTLPFP